MVQTHRGRRYMPLTRKRFSSSTFAAAGAQDVAWAVSNAISGHHGAATRAAFAPVSSSYPATACRRAASRSASDGNHQGEQAADDDSNQEPQAHGKNPRKDGCHQTGVDTLRDGLRDGVCEHVCVRVRVQVTHARDALRRATVFLQRQGEAEKAPDQGAATKHEVTQASSNHPALSMTQCHRFVIGRVFGVLN